VGEACAAYQDEHLRDLNRRTIEADEIWSFVYSKQRNVPEELKGQFGVGDVWTWTALDADTKLIVSWYVGGRQNEDAEAFILDLSDRLTVRVDRGNPDPARISTSYVERQNLTMRMGMRRFTRLTNAFSKKLDHHMAAIAIHFMHYNFARPHKTLRLRQEDGPAIKQTPAMAAGIADHIWTSEEIARLADPN
jgi:IS1 family transposase